MTKPMSPEEKERITQEEKSACPKCGREGVPWQTKWSARIFFVCECGKDWSKLILDRKDIK